MITRPRNILLLGLLVGAGLWAARAPAARASINEGLLQLASGKDDCKQKRFSEGVQKILDSAVVIQKANPNHPANARWLPQVRRCLQAWVRHTARRCASKGEPAALREMQTIKKKVKYLAAPVTKRLLDREYGRCAGRIVQIQVKACIADPGRGGLKRLDDLMKQLTSLGVGKRPLGRLAAGAERCAYRWLQDAASRCQTEASVENLSVLGKVVPQVSAGKRVEARMAYERCAQALGRRAWSICQARRYAEGRKLLREAISRYGFYKPRNRKLLETMRSKWLPRCGTWIGRGYFSARVQSGRLSYKLAAKVVVELSSTGKGKAVKGEIRVVYDAVSGKRAGCRVLITPRDGRYSVAGVAKPDREMVRVDLEKGMPQTEALEEIQITCGEQTPDLRKAHYMHRLLMKTGLFATSLPIRSGVRKRLEWRGSLGKTTRGSVTGTITVRRYK